MIIEVAVAKAKAALSVDTDKIPEEVLIEIYALGLRELIGKRGMANLTKAEYPDADELAEEALKVAEQNLKNVYANEIRKTASKATKATAKGADKEIGAEARREAMLAVKDALKRKKHKVSLIASSEITRLTNNLLASEVPGKEIWARAKATVEARKAKAAEGTEIVFDIGEVKED